MLTKVNGDCSEELRFGEVLRASLVAQMANKLPAMQETQARSLSLEDPQSGRSSGEGNGNALQYSCLEKSTTEEPGGLQSMGLKRVGHD